MCYESDWDSEILSQVTRRARKPHHCSECGKLIRPGEQYVRSTVLQDHSVSSYKDCLVCQRVIDAHFAAERAAGHGGQSYVIGSLREQIFECIQEEPHYLMAFRAAWKGEPVPRKPPARDLRHYSSVMGAQS